MKKIFKYLRNAVLAFLVLSILGVLVFRFVPVPYTFTMLTRKIQGIGSPNNQIHYTWKSYDEISHQMPLALVASEDQRFPTHHGFDFNSMAAAYKANQRGKKMRGGSTISQQVAKNVFLWQGRSYVRKGLEAYFTFLIETLWSKKRILEVYMNVSETGIRTFGVEEAARRYYHKSAKDLTRTEAAQITAIFPSPQKWDVGNGKRTRHTLRQMRLLGNGYLNSIEK